jgi:hypothetical protein
MKLGALALGPKGHYAIGHFLSAWFGQVREDRCRRHDEAMKRS